MLRLRSLPLVGAAALGLAACKGDEAGLPPPVVYTTLVGSTGATKPRFTGTIRARTESSLGFRVGGKIVARLVDPGQRVRNGQPLMRLDKADFALALGSARAAVDAARAQALKAGNDEKRSRKLATQGWVSVQGYEQAKAAADAAAAQLAAAEAQANQIGNQLDYSELQADADGIVTEVPAEPGQVVAAGQPVVKLAREGAREAEVFLPEGVAQNAGAEASARLYADHARVFEAHLRELSAVADPATRTYRARYVLSGGEAAPLGSTVTIELERSLRGSNASFEVPLGAIFDRGEGTAVWKVDPATNRVVAQAVTVARLREERAEVLSGLVEGDRIVALGAHLLKNGQAVRLAPKAVASAEP